VTQVIVKSNYKLFLITSTATWTLYMEVNAVIHQTAASKNSL
jgi:hypothetical protein